MLPPLGGPKIQKGELAEGSLRGFVVGAGRGLLRAEGAQVTADSVHGDAGSPPAVIQPAHALEAVRTVRPLRLVGVVL